ncbi:MAG: sigma-70 family RNA polymerase sigma factor [Defluviitaleaceae bacterium]|nr:sigma-70 family RNA polymerase sigma factor [Defluviitaleaceae bacterium]
MEEALERYGKAIFKYCLGILCNYHDAQDAMQETFIKAHKAEASLRLRENYGAWLYRIAYNTCLNILRGKRRWLFPVKKETAYEMPEPFIDPVLIAALETLSPADRALFYSRAVEDMDYVQLEERFGIRAATLRKRYERAKNKLKAFIERSEQT